MKIVIIGAMEKEIENYRILFELQKQEKYLIPVEEGTYLEHKIYVTKSGIGKVNAALTTQYLIDTLNPDIIINSGAAGSLDKNIKVLNLIIANSLSYHDFYPKRICIQETPENNNIKPNKELIKIATKVIKNKNLEYHQGLIVSGDHFVTEAKERDKIKKETNALAVDMESTSIAHVSKLNKIPFLIIRVISDFADGVEDFEKEAGYLSSEIIKEIIKEI